MILKLPIQEICDKYLSGMSSRKLAKEYGCDGGSIIKLLRKSGVKIRTYTESSRLAYESDPTIAERISESKTLDLPKREIYEKYQSGMSPKLLGEEYGYNEETIRKLLLKNGIKMRTRSESMKLAYVNDHTIAIRQAETLRQTYMDDHTISEKASARSQGQSYPDEWTGYAVCDQSHLKSSSQCLQLNPWFEGCERHHIMVGVIIHIPVDLHRSVQHRMTIGDRKDKNMKEINKLALEYLLGKL